MLIRHIFRCIDDQVDEDATESLPETKTFSDRAQKWEASSKVQTIYQEAAEVAKKAQQEQDALGRRKILRYKKRKKRTREKNRRFFLPSEIHHHINSVDVKFHKVLFFESTLL